MSVTKIRLILLPPKAKELLRIALLPSLLVSQLTIYGYRLPWFRSVALASQGCT